MNIGIDFSINSTAMTIIKDGKTLFYSFVPNYRENLKAFKTHKDISDLVIIKSYIKEEGSKNPIEDQSIKLKNADRLSDLIIESIKENVEENPKIFIEGYSFGSKGNSFIDMITYNTFLKVKIIQNWGNCIYVIPPKSIKKKFTGNGNASKFDMLKSFLSKDSLLKDRLIEIGLDKSEEFNIPKPVDDIIDSVALSEWEM